MKEVRLYHYADEKKDKLQIAGHINLPDSVDPNEQHFIVAEGIVYTRIYNNDNMGLSFDFVAQDGYVSPLSPIIKISNLSRPEIEDEALKAVKAFEEQQTTETKMSDEEIGDRLQNILQPPKKLLNSLSHTFDTKHNNPCIEKAGDTEPIFVLRAQDKTAPAVVAYWMNLNVETIKHPDKLNKAFQTLIAMRDWKPRRHAD